MPVSFFHGLSIRWRLLAMMMAVVTVAAVVGYGWFAYQQMAAQQQRLEATSRSLAEVLSQDFARLAILGEAAVAADVTARLEAFPAVRRALFYDAANEPLLEYRHEQYRSDSVPEFAPPLAGPGQVHRTHGSLHLHLPVAYAGQGLGTLYLKLQSDSVAELLRRDLLMLLQVGLLSLLFALVLAVRLERRFNAPVRQLVDFLEQVDADAGLEPRLNLGDSSEFDRIYRAVNALLDRIQASQAELRQAASVFEHANEGIVITDCTGNVLDVNTAFTRITLYEKSEVLGRNPRLLQSGRQNPAFYAVMWRTLLDEGRWRGEIWNRRKNGEVHPQWVTISAIEGRAGVRQGYVGLFYDISDIKEQQRQLEQLAHYDALTGLPNRTLLADRIQQSMHQAERRSTLVALAYLDIDGFKAVNDSHGHALGDKLLVELARRMTQALREGDTLARLGGDEFVIVMPDLTHHGAAIPAVERLLQVLAEPIEIDGLLLRVSASIGIAYYPQNTPVDADQLLRQADQSMYSAKRSGKNRYHLYDAEQDRLLQERNASIERLRLALINEEFVLFFQPQIHLRSGSVVGFEALLRWRHPERGLLAPGQFLPLIEEHDLIVAVGDWAIEQALQHMELWRRQGQNLPVSVNVAARQLQAPEFLDKLKATLALYPQVARQLKLEVLETSALADLVDVARLIASCQGLGVEFAIDDFGTGYSSLTYLKHFPALMLKIDQGFVRGMLEEPDNLAILEGIVVLAESLGRTAVAEGVETWAHAEMLLRLGCEYAQGYAIARPMPAQEVLAWGAGWQPQGLFRRYARADRDHMPALQTMVEMGAWVVALRRHLQEAAPEGTGAALPDYQGQRLADWLARTEHAMPDRVASFSRIRGLQAAMQRLAGELLALERTDGAAAALARWSEIEARRDALIESLQELIDAQLGLPRP